MPYTPGQQYTTNGVNLQPYRSKRMDPYLSSIYGTEQSLYDPPISDKSSLDTTVYASSPNSCFMYEQERADMQSTLGGMSVKNSRAMSEDFDLNSQFETSRDITLPMDKKSGSLPSETCENMNKNWTIDSKSASDVDFLNFDLFDMEQDVSGNPTLAELNASESLLDDLASIMDTSIKETESNKVWSASTSKQDVSDMVCQPQAKTCWSSTPSQVLRTQQTQVKGAVPPYKLSNSVGRRPSATVTSEIENSSLTASVPKLHQLLQPRNKEVDTEASSSPLQCTSSQKSQPGTLKRKQSITSKEMEEKWEEIKHYIYDSDADDEDEQLPRKQKRLSTDSMENEESESDHDSPADSDSDFDDDNSQGSWSYKQETDGSQRKSRQYFWQYNLQSKGPKGARVNFEQLENDDPHVLKDFEDPVFDPVASKYVTGTTIRHGGKARRGDGTDVSPNPKKLYQIGQQINKLNKQIDSFIPLSEMPVSSRNKSKKEKNKLASRACRLKKKAQHEAYKIKLYGLDMEHKQLLKLTREMKEKFADVLHRTLPERNVLKPEVGDNLQMTKFLEDLAVKKYTYKVAGDTTEFVNRVLCKVEDGDPTGGLDQT